MKAGVPALRPPHIGVLGLGAMGRHIAMLAARAGHDVVVWDLSEDTRDRVGDWIRGGPLSSSRVQVCSSAAEVAQSADVIIEAVPDDFDVKVSVLREVLEAGWDGVVLATNTSALDLAALGRAIEYSDLLVMHFFNPATTMKLVEVAASSGVRTHSLSYAEELLSTWGKVPLRVSPRPGLIVNRLTRPFFLEPQRLVEETGASVESVDEAVRRGLSFGWGPFEVMDFVGQDVNLSTSEKIYAASANDPRLKPTSLQRNLVELGHLGRKTGKGAYRYDEDGHKLVSGASLGAGAGDERICDRIVVQTIVQAIDCMGDGVSSPQDIDRAMVLGANYPQGPFAWLNSYGAEWVLETLDEFSSMVSSTRYWANPAVVRVLKGSVVR